MTDFDQLDTTDTMTDTDFDQRSDPVESITFNEAPDIEPGVYPAVLTSIEKRMGTDDAGNPDPFWSWTFAVQAAGATVELRGSSSTAHGPNSKAFAWTVALVGSARMSGSNIRIDPAVDLVGCACQVDVRLNASGYPKVKAVIAPAKV